MTRKQRIAVLKLTDPDKQYEMAKMLAGYNQTRLAQAIGVSSSLLCLFETGKRTPSHEQVQALADALDVPVQFVRLPVQHSEVA